MITLTPMEVQQAVLDFLRKSRKPTTYAPSLVINTDGSASIQEACHNDTGPDIGYHVSVTARCCLPQGHPGDHTYDDGDVIICWPREPGEP
jgi:hypothetical protein